MCNRYRVSKKDIQVAAERFQIPNARVSPQITDRYNLAPKQYGPVIKPSNDGPLEIAMLRWGLIPSWSKTEKTPHPYNNARSDTVQTSPVWRESFRHRRCLIIATAIYEWTGPKGDKQGWHITLEDQDLMMIAGLWSRWQPANQEQQLDTYSFVMTDVNPFMATYHDRMPVFLKPDAYFQWLEGTPDEAAELMIPYTGKMSAYKVTRKMNSWKFEDPEACAPIRDLFD